MSYKQAMKWHKQHPTGGKPQYMGFATSSGFWPSGAWLKERFWPYLEKCESCGIEPMDMEMFYKHGHDARLAQLPQTLS